MKMKDGSTHMAHKAEHAVDMETGAVVAVTVQAANLGDTASVQATLEQAGEHIAVVAEAINAAAGQEIVQPDGPAELVTDKGYHSREVVLEQKEAGVRTYISEPDRGPQNWTDQKAEQSAVYGNRRRVRGERGKALQRQRGEKLERVNAHLYETGGMRRVHLRGHDNILKRLLIHAGGLNLGLLMRTLCGVGTPRGLQGKRLGTSFARFGMIYYILTWFANSIFNEKVKEEANQVTSRRDETPTHHPSFCLYSLARL